MHTIVITGASLVFVGILWRYKRQEKRQREIELRENKAAAERYSEAA